MATQAIVAQAITKDFINGDEVSQVLHGIDLTINKGQLSMLVGPSGCGKTTLLSILTGILTPTSGSVFVGDEELTALSGDRKARFRRDAFGFIFQQFNLLPSLTAAENAGVVLTARGMRLSAAAQEASEILSRIGMGDHLHKLPSQLSGGQQQRIAIARALAHNPDIVVCDEPTASLDAHTGHAVMEILEAIAREQNRAVIVVTHDNRIFNFADRILKMDDGMIQHEEIIKKGPTA